MIQNSSASSPQFWWVGQVCDESYWRKNLNDKIHKKEDSPGFGYRYKCRIFGRDGEDKNKVNDEQLEWIPVCLPTTAGGGNGGCFQTPNIRQGNYVMGFYLDGIAATQPVITGIFPNDPRTSFFPGDPTKNFVARDGFYGIDGQKIVSENHLYLYNQTEAPTNNGGTGGAGIANIADKKQADDGKRQFYIPKTKACSGPSGEIKGIQLLIRNLVSLINRIKAEYEGFYSAASNITNQIRSVLGDVSMFISKLLKTLIEKIRSYIMNAINKGVQSLIDLLPPNLRPNAKDANEAANSTLQCVFNKIMQSLIDLVYKTLLSLIDKFINAPMCAAENFVGTIFSNIFGQITDGIEQALQAIEGALGAVANFSSQIFSALDIVVGVLNFLSCDEPLDCTMGEAWTFWGGVEESGEFVRAGIGSFFNGVIAGVSTGITTSITPPCNTSALPCGVPRISITGGGGAGAIGNPVVSTTGAILGIDFISGGSGYTSPPSLNIIDDCGLGDGAVAIPIIIPRTTGIGTTGNPSPDSGFVESNVQASTPRPTQLIRNERRKTLFTDIDNLPLIVGGSKGKKLTFDDQPITSNRKYDVNPKNKNIEQLNQTIDEINKNKNSRINSFKTIRDINSDIIPENPNLKNTTNTLNRNIKRLASANNIDNIQDTRNEMNFNDELNTINNNLNQIRQNLNNLNDQNGIINSINDNIDTINSILDNLTNQYINSNEQSSLNLGGEGGVDVVVGGNGTPILTAYNDFLKVNAIGGRPITVNNRVVTIGGIPVTVGGEGGTELRSRGTEITDGSLSGAIILDSGTGYLSFPNGDLGGSGSVWAKRGTTIVQRSNGNYDPPYSPGTTVNVAPGDTVQFPGQVPKIIVKNETITAPRVDASTIPALPTPSSTYPVVLSIADVVITNSGVSYLPTDKITITPDNGAILDPKYDQQGRLINVNVVNPGIGFTDFPKITIKSTRGVNAQITPVFSITRLNEIDEGQTIIPAGTPVINVVDCVGKFNS